MFSDFIIFILSLLGLLYASDLFVDLAIRLSDRLKLSRMAIGLTVVAIGTSLPEAAASVVASLSGHPEIALGNVVGSNICNIGLILGLPALIAPILCSKAVLFKEGALMLALSVLLWGITLVSDSIGPFIGISFIVAFCFYIYFVLRHSGELEESLAATEGAEDSCWMLMFSSILSMGAMLFCSDYLIDSSVSLAHTFSVSETVIAISLVALGTSLPELSVSVAAVRKNEGDILVGNILGSNISNILLVIGLASSIAPVTVSPISPMIDMPLMVLAAILAIFFLSQKEGLTRSRGLILLSLYAIVIVRCFTL